MTETSLLYHDGCKICLSVVASVSSLFEQAGLPLTVVDLSAQPELTAAAENAGVKTLPTLLHEGKVLEILPHAPVAEFRATPAAA